jgi:hypothetical protein
MSELFPKCPCNVCIVQAVCNESCIEEILWYSDLSEKDKLKYGEAGKYKSNMSIEAANIVSEKYHGYITLLMRKKEK